MVKIKKKPAFRHLMSLTSAETSSLQIKCLFRYFGVYLRENRRSICKQAKDTYDEGFDYAGGNG